MTKIRIAVVDDSAFMRKLISEMIEEDEIFEVVAKFRNGKELVDKGENYNFDVVTLDIEMPILDGPDTLRELKRRNIKYKVIMLSSLSKRGSEKTMECLDLGALDFVMKPSGFVKDMNEIKVELTQKILEIQKEKKLDRGIKKQKVKTKIPKKLEDNELLKSSKDEINIKAIVIGASTGGPKALQQVLPLFDKGINVPIFVVQHMPKGFTKAFSERMNRLCKIRVVEAEDNMKIEKDTIYIAPGGRHMIVFNEDIIKLNNDPTMWGVRPAVDKLFESAVEVYKGNVISAILTGMGKDGAKGTELVKKAGGITISEAEETCTIYGMPRSAYETGMVDMVLRIEEIGAKISLITKGR